MGRKRALPVDLRDKMSADFTLKALFFLALSLPTGNAKVELQGQLSTDCYGFPAERFTRTNSVRHTYGQRYVLRIGRLQTQTSYTAPTHYEYVYDACVTSVCGMYAALA
jgi:hypothetical protein